jgi:hypothetical protein
LNYDIAPDIKEKLAEKSMPTCPHSELDRTEVSYSYCNTELFKAAVKEGACNKQVPTMHGTFGRIATKTAANPYGLGMDCVIMDIEKNGKSITEYWLWVTARSQKFKPQ